MKNLSIKLIEHLKSKNSVNPNFCQRKASEEIEKLLETKISNKLLNFFKPQTVGIYLYGDVGVGKSLILKALDVIHKNSEIFHFSDLIFHLQKLNVKKSDFHSLCKKKIIIVDEFYISSLTSLILFKKFMEEIILRKKIVIMSGNKILNNLYSDPINIELCKGFAQLLGKQFHQIQMFSKIDYRKVSKSKRDFFFIKKRNSLKSQDLLIKKFSKSSFPSKTILKRKGNEFSVYKSYENLVDLDFNFFSKSLAYKDYQILVETFKIIIIRNLTQINDESKDIIARFISFIDISYDNKNILSISSNVELSNFYIGKNKAFDYKRTLSRLIEMGSEMYIKNNLIITKK